MSSFSALFKRFASLSVTGLVLLFAASGANAQDGQIIPAIMVVDLQRVMENSKAADSLQAQLDVVNDKNQGEMAPQAEVVKAARQKLQKDRASLSFEDFNKEKAEVDRLTAEYQKEVATRKSELQARMNGSMRDIQKKVNQVVIEIAGERGVNLVISKASVIIMAGEFDATKDTLARLDEQMPVVTLK